MTTSKSGGTNGWQQYQKLVMSELAKLDKRTGRIEDKVNKIHVELGILKLKCSMLGLIAGAIPAVVSAIWVMTQS